MVPEKEPEAARMKIVLENISLQLGPIHLRINATLSGRSTGIFGPSGSGKTSLLEIIAGLKKPASALVKAGDRVLTDSSKNFRLPPQHRRIGYVPQDLALFPHLNVRRNLAYGLKPAAGNKEPIVWDHVIEVLEIGGLLPRDVLSLSGGEKQRVAFARALMASPKLLLLDEPLASLDQILKEKILAYLVRVRDEFSIPLIYVSHDPREIHALCDEVLVLDQGSPIAQGSPAEILKA